MHVRTGAALLAFALTAEAQDVRVLPEQLDGGIKPRDMMKHYLRGKVHAQHAHWVRAFNARKSPEQIEQYQVKLRWRFLNALGGFPERTPLNPRVVGVIRRTGYRVEKVIFESQPRHYVTGALFVPDGAQRAPGVLVPCGHTHNAKAHGTYQRAAALLAQNGLVALIFDPIDQGERMQWLKPDGNPRTWGTTGHIMTGVGSILVGRNTATYEVWDAMRAIDYLQSRPEVDPEKIGCMGNSGGGTQTSHLMALDDRVKAASPSCYICSFPKLIDTIGVQDAEQNIFGQLAFGMDHADYLMMRAPTPVLLCAATRDFFAISGTWDTYRYAKRFFVRLGRPECVDLMEDDRPHNYDRPAREASVRWMLRWLAGKDEPVTEGDIQQLSDAEMRCTPKGQVMRIEGARSVYDLNREYEAQLATQRAKTPLAQKLQAARRRAGVRKLAELPAPRVETVDKDKVVLHPEAGIRLPALLLGPERPARTVLYVNGKGKAAQLDRIKKLAAEGARVLAVDLRGTGETQQNSQGYFRPHQGADGQDFYTAYVLGKTYVGMRAEDILVCARHLAGDGPVHLVAVGHVGVPALHAAALEPQLFASVRLEDCLESWASVVKEGWSTNQLINTVHGALRDYDLPDLRAALADKLK